MLKVTANQNKNYSCKMCNSLALVMGGAFNILERLYLLS